MAESTDPYTVIQDTSQWPNLVQRLLARGNITDEQAELLVGGNLLRVWQEVDRVAKVTQDKGELPCEESWDGRLWEPETFEVPRLYPN